MGSIESAAAVTPVFQVKAVIFDLDGTLVDSAPDLATAVNVMLATLDRPMITLAQARQWIGNGAAQLVKRALTGEMWAEPEAELFKTANANFLQAYETHLCDDTVPYPGAHALLSKLHQQGYRLGCVTNKPARFTLPLLEQLGMQPYLDGVISGDTLAKKKPEPDQLIALCKQFDIPPTETLLVGDSENDIQAAQAAGMPTVCVTYGYHQGVDLHALNSDVMIDSLEEVEPLLTPPQV